MEILLHVLLGFTALVLVIAAPSETAKVETVEETSANDHTVEVLNEDANADFTQGERQKRWYNYPNFGVPPFYTPPLRFFGEEQEEEPYRQIYRKIKDISSFLREPSQPSWLQQPSHFYLPVIFVPRLSGCKCPANENRPTPGPQPATPAPTYPPAPTNQPPVPNTVGPRFPEMEDTRQNWGLASDENEPEEEEFNRDLSFDPILPTVPTSRPPPSVEHGSSQAGQPIDGSNADRVAPTAAPPRPALTPTARALPNPPPTANPGQVDEPTNCDKAILSCCHQKQVTYQCFIDLECPNLAPYGNDPCAVNVILSATKKISRFYERTG